MASTHVVFKLKSGEEKVLYLPLAQSLEKKNQGKIVAPVLNDEETLEARAKELDKREKQIEKREKALDKLSNKEDKAAKQRSNKAEL